MMTSEQIYEIFPEIRLIHSEELREKSIACWQDVIELGGWEKKGIMNSPLAAGLVADDCPEKGMDHCRRVTRMCETAYNELGEWANRISHLDHDTLVCAAVLHDIGKLLEYDWVDGHAVHSENGKLFSHVESGAYIAKKHGVPDKIVYMIMMHSDGQSPKYIPSDFPELMMLKKLDHMCYCIAAMKYPAK